MKRILMATAVAASLAGAPLVARACADGPDFLRVTDVASNDVLNVRSGPGLGFSIVGALPYDAVNVENLDSVPTHVCDGFETLNDFERKNFWTKIRWTERGKHVIGWAKSNFLRE